MSLREVSVVMSVYNGGRSLSASVESVLAQQGVDFELVVVDDGSTDGSGQLLDSYARNTPVLKVLHQPNLGLTAGLRAGCAAACGQYIARQDSGDLSLPGRLARLAEVLRRRPEVGLVSVGSRFLGPEDEFLYEIVQSNEEADAGLRRLDAATITGPSSHGATMFRRDAYEALEGYRSEFRVAQDLDLWLRLTERSKASAIQEVLYVARVSLDSISALRRDCQLAVARIALECAKRRRRGDNEADLLAEARRASNASTKRSNARQARSANFIAGCLRKRDPERARKYYRLSLSLSPLQWRAWAGFLSTPRARG